MKNKTQAKKGDIPDEILRLIANSNRSVPLVIDYHKRFLGFRYDRQPEAYARCVTDMIDLLKRTELSDRTFGVCSGFSRDGIPGIARPGFEAYVFIQFKTESEAEEFRNILEKEKKMNKRYRHYSAFFPPAETPIGLANYTPLELIK